MQYHLLLKWPNSLRSVSFESSSAQRSRNCFPFSVERSLSNRPRRSCRPSPVPIPLKLSCWIGRGRKLAGNELGALRINFVNWGSFFYVVRLSLLSCRWKYLGNVDKIANGDISGWHVDAVEGKLIKRLSRRLRSNVSLLIWRSFQCWPSFRVIWFGNKHVGFDGWW